MPSPKKLSDIKSLFTNVAQTTHYEVKLSSIPEQFKKYLKSKGEYNEKFISEELGLLCINAILPPTNLSYSKVIGNSIGIQENFAYRKTFNEMRLEFYVDNQYKVMNFFQNWIDFITSGANYIIEDENILRLSEKMPPVANNLFYKFQYPEYYKCDSLKIYKFEKSYDHIIEYNFRGLFPVSIDPINVSYINSESLKLNVNFAYDRQDYGKNKRINPGKTNIKK